GQNNHLLPLHHGRQHHHRHYHHHYHHHRDLHGHHVHYSARSRFLVASLPHSAHRTAGSAADSLLHCLSSHLSTLNLLYLHLLCIPAYGPYAGVGFGSGLGPGDHGAGAEAAGAEAAGAEAADADEEAGAEAAADDAAAAAPEGEYR